MGLQYIVIVIHNFFIAWLIERDTFSIVLTNRQLTKQGAYVDDGRQTVMRYLPDKNARKFEFLCHQDQSLWMHSIYLRINLNTCYIDENYYGIDIHTINLSVVSTKSRTPSSGSSSVGC